jgi:hypothetical protein
MPEASVNVKIGLYIEPPFDDVLRSISMTVPGALDARMTKVAVLNSQIRPAMAVKLPMRIKPPPTILAGESLASEVFMRVIPPHYQGLSFSRRER